MSNVIESLARRLSKETVPAEAMRQAKIVVDIVSKIPETIEVRGFGSAFNGKDKWDPHRKPRGSDIDLAVIFSGSKQWSCFATGSKMIPYGDEEGDISYYPGETDIRSELRKRIEEEAPLVSLFMMTTTDISQMILGIKTNSGIRCTIFDGITSLHKMIWDIKRGQLLWKKQRYTK